MARRTKSGDHRFTRTCQIQGRSANETYALIQKDRIRSRVAPLRPDGTADASREELVLTADLLEVKRTHFATMGQRGTVTLPVALRSSLGLDEGIRIEIVEEGGYCVLRPLPASTTGDPKAALADVLSQVTPESLHGEIATGPPVGREAW